MAAPSTPSNVLVQQGNGNVLVSWDLTSTATSYKVQRSTDGITYSVVSTAAPIQYLDTTVTVGTLYYYQVAASNGSGDSSYSTAQTIVPAPTGDMTLGQIRLLSQQEADMVNSNFVSNTEWNTYINNSAFELYDILTTVYEDYNVYPPIIIPTAGSQSQYTLPTGSNTFLDSDLNTITPPPFYKLLGVDLGLSNSQNAWVTLKKFDFISRNRFLYPQLNSTYLGVFNLRYRLVGNTIMFIPSPASGQYIRFWMIPRMTTLLKDTDILTGVSGWGEYVVVDAAIKAMGKEESDTSALMIRKQALLKRIEESAMNRDAGIPDTISDVRSQAERWGGWNGDGSSGGY